MRNESKITLKRDNFPEENSDFATRLARMFKIAS